MLEMGVASQAARVPGPRSYCWEHMFIFFQLKYVYATARVFVNPADTWKQRYAGSFRLAIPSQSNPHDAIPSLAVVP